jgi:competence protein ComEC
MIKLRYGYLFVGIVMGLIFIVQFLTSLPDGKLYITFCNVGQGDSAYLRFPDGRDMLIDGGPNEKSVLACLSSVMPFWDRQLDAVVLTHPDQDHFKGLVAVLNRYRVGVLYRSAISNESDSFQAFENQIKDAGVPVRFVTAQDRIKLGSVALVSLWPTKNFLSQTNNSLTLSGLDVLGAGAINRNDFSLVLHLRFGVFDAIFTGDGDSRIQNFYTSSLSFSDEVEVLKVPHHGSATGMTQDFIERIHPRYAIISVGKNNLYNHPRKETLEQLEGVKAKVYRTDLDGTITVTTDGKNTTISKSK